MRNWIRVRLYCSQKQMNEQKGEIAEVREDKEIEPYMNRNRSGFGTSGLDAGGAEKNWEMKQEAVDINW